MALPVTDQWFQSSGSTQSITAYNAAYSLMEGALKIESPNTGRLEGNGSTYNTARRNDETFSSEQYAQIKLISTSYYAGPAVRCQSGENTSYHVETNGTNFYLSKCVAGSQSTLAGPVTQSFAVGDFLRLEVTGTGATVTLKVYKALAASPTSFSQVGTTYTDSTGTRIVSAGSGGVFVYGITSGHGAGAWESGNLTAGSTQAPRSRHQFAMRRN